MDDGDDARCAHALSRFHVGSWIGATTNFQRDLVEPIWLGSFCVLRRARIGHGCIAPLVIWIFFSKDLGAPAPQCEEMCWLCSANPDDLGMPWNCFHKDRRPNHWMTTPRNPPFHFAHPLFDAWGVTGDSLFLDSMR
eukprot:2564222-Pyramimonas_sp.AAC.1